MRINEDQLTSSLNKKLHNVYVILGKESIRIEEILENILVKAKTENFTEKETHVIGNQADWDFLSSHKSNLDLFGAKKIILIKLIEQGPGIKGAKALKTYAGELDPSTLLLVTGEGLEKKSYSAAWVKELERLGALVSIRPLSTSTLSTWILEKGLNNNLNILREAVHLLAEKTEGNLMATLQEINKLSLIYPKQTIDREKMEKSITNSSRYNVFDFSNAFIAGDKKGAIKILEFLKSEGVPETLILWSISKELSNLFSVSQKGSIKGLWGPKHYLDNLERSAKRISKIRILEAFKQVAQIDSSIKGIIKENPWLGLRELTITF